MLAGDKRHIRSDVGSTAPVCASAWHCVESSLATVDRSAPAIQRIASLRPMTGSRSQSLPLRGVDRGSNDTRVFEGFDIGGYDG